MLERVAEGETLTVTKDGEPVALVAPLPRHPLNATQLVELFRGLNRAVFGSGFVSRLRRGV